MIDRAFLPYVVNLPQPPFLLNGLARKMLVTPDHKLILLANDGLSFSVINLQEPKSIMTYARGTGTHDIDYIGGTSSVSITTKEGIFKWDLSQEQPQVIIEGNYQEVSWSPDGQQFAATQDLIKNGLHHPLVKVFQLGSSAPLWTKYIELDTKSYRDSNPFTVEVAWSPTGNRIATLVQLDTAIDVWDASSGAHLDRLTLNNGILNVDWSPDGAYLAIAHLAGVSIWSPEG